MTFSYNQLRKWSKIYCGFNAYHYHSPSLHMHTLSCFMGTPGHPKISQHLSAEKRAAHNFGASFVGGLGITTPRKMRPFFHGLFHDKKLTAEKQHWPLWAVFFRLSLSIFVDSWNNPRLCGEKCASKKTHRPFSQPPYPRSHATSCSSVWTPLVPLPQQVPPPPAPVSQMVLQGQGPRVPSASWLEVFLIRFRKFRWECPFLAGIFGHWFRGFYSTKSTRLGILREICAF